MEVKWQRAAACVVVLDAKGCLLLTRFEKIGHPQSGMWTLPGGGMEWGEQPIETAIRELKEETGLSADVGPLLGALSAWFDADGYGTGQPGHSIRLVFEGTNCIGELKQDFTDDDTTAAAGWFTIEEVTQLHRGAIVDYALDLISKQ